MLDQTAARFVDQHSVSFFSLSRFVAHPRRTRYGGRMLDTLGSCATSSTLICSHDDRTSHSFHWLSLDTQYNDKGKRSKHSFLASKLIQISVAQFAAVWFPENKRATAGMFVASNYGGIIAMFLMPAVATGEDNIQVTASICLIAHR